MTYTEEIYTVLNKVVWIYCVNTTCLLSFFGQKLLKHIVCYLTMHRNFQTHCKHMIYRHNTHGMRIHCSFSNGSIDLSVFFSQQFRDVRGLKGSQSCSKGYPSSYLIESL